VPGIEIIGWGGKIYFPSPDPRGTGAVSHLDAWNPKPYVWDSSLSVWNVSQCPKGRIGKRVKFPRGSAAVTGYNFREVQSIAAAIGEGGKKDGEVES
jgi:hypothetical protein